ncbi:MAG: ABC transporter permease, partial [Candidatus Ventricola sp.]|nr:ABC transporter permease [Candidatus Ventricola sp.]
MISSFKMALRSIGSNKMRAALTMLGIIIGVMALVVLVSLVNGATSTVTDEVASLGSNYVDAYVWRQEVGSSLTVNDLKKWAQENESVEAVAPINRSSAKGKAGSSSDDIDLIGTMPAYGDINGLTIEYGRFLKNADVDNASRVCVLSKQAAEQIVGYTDCVGEDFSVDGMRYTIVGVLGERTS